MVGREGEDEGVHASIPSADSSVHMDHLLHLPGLGELRWKQREGGREGKGKLELRGNGDQTWGSLVELLLSQVGFTQPSGTQNLGVY